MSTRGLYGVRKKGVDKLTYNHNDSYPQHLGKNYIEFIKQAGIEGLNHWHDNIYLVPDNEKNYREYRDYQGNFDAYLRGGGLTKPVAMVDCHDFIENGVFCEYAYIVNLDTNKLEFYVGFQEEPQHNRYTTEKTLQKLERDYQDTSVKNVYPCHNIAEIELEDILEYPAEQIENYLIFAEMAYSAKSTEKKDINSALYMHYTDKYAEKIMQDFNNQWNEYKGMYKKYKPFRDNVTPEQKTHTIGDVMNRVRELDLNGGREQASVLMDIEYGREAFGFTYDDLMALNDFNFAHDVVGIQNNIDRSVSVHKREKNEPYTEKDFNCFRPRVCDIKQIQENEKSEKQDPAPQRDVVKNAQVADKVVGKDINKKK